MHISAGMPSRKLLNCQREKKSLLGELLKEKLCLNFLELLNELARSILIFSRNNQHRDSFAFRAFENIENGTTVKDDNNHHHQATKARWLGGSYKIIAMIKDLWSYDC